MTRRARRELRSDRITVWHTPHDRDTYLTSLMASLGELGVSSSFLVEPTRSETINLALLPATLAWGRLTGVRVIHLHWAYSFRPAWASTRRRQRLMRWWFVFVLRALHLVGLKLVWTAHNVLPHEPIFDDDVAGRRHLVSAADAVIAHDDVTATILDERFGVHGAAVIPQGAVLFEERDRTGARRALGWESDDLLVLAGIGRIRRYKGFDDVLGACLLLAERRPDVVARLRLLIQGDCSDPTLRAELIAQAEACREKGVTVTLAFGRMSPEELSDAHSAADVLLYPFRTVTNSGSLISGLGFGRPAIMADLPTLAGVPESAVLRYRPGLEHLARAIEEMASWTADQRRDAGLAGQAWATSFSWEATARSTKAVYRSVLGLVP